MGRLARSSEQNRIRTAVEDALVKDAIESISSWHGTNQEAVNRAGMNIGELTDYAISLIRGAPEPGITNDAGLKVIREAAPGLLDSLANTISPYGGYVELWRNVRSRYHLQQTRKLIGEFLRSDGTTALFTRSGYDLLTVIDHAIVVYRGGDLSRYDYYKGDFRTLVTRAVDIIEKGSEARAGLGKSSHSTLMT